jgi:inner membrane protein
MELPISPAYIWAIIGVGLIIFEVFTSTFFILFFGVAALVVAGLKAFGLDHLETEILIFAAVGLAGTLIFRKKLLKSFQSTAKVSADREKVITLSHTVPAKGSAQISYQGTMWTAVNEGQIDLPEGAHAVISRVDGVKLIIKAKKDDNELKI